MAGEKDVVIIYDPLDLELVKYVSGRITSVTHQQRNIPYSTLNSTSPDYLRTFTPFVHEHSLLSTVHNYVSS